MIFDNETFMIYFYKDIEINIQCLEYFKKDTLEVATILQHNNMTDTKVKKNMMHEIICKSN